MMSQPQPSGATDVTVLMAVYHGDRPAAVKEAIDSIWAQTLSVTDFLIVVDGAVPESLANLLHEEERAHATFLRVLWLPSNVGLAAALNSALEHCSRTWVARMDADDVSVPHRLEQQMGFLASHNDVALLGSSYVQMDATMTKASGERRLPEDHDAIVRFAKHRTPFNHVTAVMRLAALRAIGGYDRIAGQLEDWWLALRLIAGGYRLHNLPEALVLVRGGADFQSRRAGLKYARMEYQNFRAMAREGLMTPTTATVNILARSAVRFLPRHVVQLIYSWILRSRHQPK